jgi:hypothetical protein
MTGQAVVVVVVVGVVVVVVVVGVVDDDHLEGMRCVAAALLHGAAEQLRPTLVAQQ